ncbi:hypothetical protein DMENIID0001_050690 [Sergentomyia squamirostris]
MRFVAGLSIFSRCTPLCGYPVQLQKISYRKIESVSPIHTLIQRKKWNEQKIREMDKLPSDYSLIYRNPMYNYVSGVTYVTAGSFLAIGTFLACSIYTGQLQYSLPESIEATADQTALSSDILEVYVMSGMFILMNAILRITINRFPLRIYRRGQQYLSIYTWRWNFQNVKHEFKQGDVVKTPKSGFIWQDCRYTINGRKNIILSEYFKTPAELYNMMMPPPVKKS